jgi:cytochrome c-type biogenesis protein CcmH/NrfG
MSQLFGGTEIHQSATRLDATLGNSTYLAVYCLFHVFIAAFLWLRDGQKNVWRWVYIMIALLNGFIMFYTQTRGALLGLIGGTFLTGLLIAFFDKEHPKMKQVAFGLIFVVVLIVGGFLTIKNTQYVRNHPVLHRFAEISLTEQTVQSRFLIWNMSWQGFKERPILGWGQDNFIYVFSKYYDPKMFNQEPWFDRSHDVFFDWLIAGGILGLLAYLSLFFVALYYLWFTKRHDLTVPEKAVLTGLLAGYFCHNIFVFDNLTSYLLFYSVLAYIHAHYADKTEVEVQQKPAKKKKDKDEEQDVWIIVSVLFLATAAMVYYVNIRNINANLSLIDSLRNPIVKDEKGQPVIAIEKVLNLRLFGTSEAREQLGQLAFQALDPRLDTNLRDKIFALTKAEFETELKNDPENLRYESFVALLYSRYGMYQQAEEHFKRALDLSPSRQSTWIDLGTMYLQTGNSAQAEAAFKTAFDLTHDYSEARMYYAIGLIYNKKFAEADEIMKGVDEGSARLRYDNRLINAYGNNKQYQRVVDLINDKIAANAATGRDWISLGGAYMELGQKQKAIESFLTASSTDSSLGAQADQFINQIQKSK